MKRVQIDIFHQSIRGIQHEIDRRTWKISGLMIDIRGDVKAFKKPSGNPYPLMVEALHLNREVKKLRAIREDLRRVSELS